MRRESLSHLLAAFAGGWSIGAYAQQPAMPVIAFPA